MKELNVALLGLGTVGSGVVKIIEENRQQIKDTLNKDIVIKKLYERIKMQNDYILTTNNTINENLQQYTECVSRVSN